MGGVWGGVSSKALFVGLFAVTPDYKYPACQPNVSWIRPSFGVQSGSSTWFAPVIQQVIQSGKGDACAGQW